MVRLVYCCPEAQECAYQCFIGRAFAWLLKQEDDVEGGFQVPGVEEGGRKVGGLEAKG